MAMPLPIAWHWSRKELNRTRAGNEANRDKKKRDLSGSEEESKQTRIAKNTMRSCID
jgi:hypothetical protein